MFGKTVRGPAGHIQIVTPEGPTIELETLQCVHCGMHWVRQPGSGKLRGFCMKCKGVTCGAERCMECLPHEAQIELMEGAKPGAPARRYLDSFREKNGG